MIRISRQPSVCKVSFISRRLFQILQLSHRKIQVNLFEFPELRATGTTRDSWFNCQFLIPLLQLVHSPIAPLETHCFGCFCAHIYVRPIFTPHCYFPDFNPCRRTIFRRSCRHRKVSRFTCTLHQSISSFATAGLRQKSTYLKRRAVAVELPYTQSHYLHKCHPLVTCAVVWDAQAHTVTVSCTKLIKSSLCL